ncbi:MAG: hypothetical protein QGF53_10270, partial [Alphaproteobacteria bacterium]|nr:hypothetical protein [Alphaproteobacteria bacterium]
MTGPAGFSGLLLSGRAAHWEGNAVGATEGLERAGRLAVTPLQWNSLAHAWLEVGRPARAVDWAERMRAAWLDGDKPLPPLSDLTLLIQLYAKCGAQKVARPIVERAEALLDHEPQAWAMIADAWIDVGNDERARELLENNPAVDDGAAWFAQGRAQSWARLGDCERSDTLL